MKKLQAPALPVKAIGAPVAHGAEQAEPFVQRWLDMQRALMMSQLSACESPIETVFALAMLSAVDNDGPLLRLIEPQVGIVRDQALGKHLAFGRAGSFFAQREVDLGRRGSIRVDFILVSDRKLIAIELDGHDFHASKAQRSEDASRDRDLIKHGWVPLRFTGSDIWRDANGCAAEVFVLLGIKIARGPALRPAEKSPKKEAASTMEQSKEGASSVLAALAAMPEGPIPRPSTGKR